MCGICGFTQAVSEDLPILKSMCDRIAHRGPDGEGQYIADGVALGHRRLSLIDLEGGTQPMIQDDGDFVIVYNGEIYNYRDLRAELVGEGWSFATNSDTEVLLTGYRAWGTDVLLRLRGMFAFAIWDKGKGQLFCARDFFGIKPFYYTMQDGRFVFASEIKSILEHPCYVPAVNENALEQYLCFQFNPLDETFFQGVFKLPPAHYLVVGLDGSTEMVRYWRPDYQADTTRTYDETVDAIHDAMMDSVKYHNVADVEVGSFLSSGIDSSYMAACLARVNPDIKTFTVGFAEYEGERDEISWASELADELGIGNSSKHISEEEYWESIPRVQWHMDEPSGDPSAIALYFVDQLAAKDVKAVLSGEGADEFFAGYRIYQVPLSNKKVQWVPRPLRSAAVALLKTLGLRGWRYLKRSLEQPEDWYYTNANEVAFTYDQARHLLVKPLRTSEPRCITEPAYAEVSSLNPIARMQHVDLAFWLVGDILLKTDKMSMAHSLESRVPFLDTKVFDLSASIPVAMKVSDRQTKIALRDASLKAIPRDWAQKEKLGFPVPIVNWIRQDKYYAQIKEAFCGPVSRKYFNVDVLVALLDEHKAGADNSRKIWIVYMFLIWHHEYFEER